MTEVTKEMILDYLVKKGGVVKNVDLVRHFRKYLQVENPLQKGMYWVAPYLVLLNILYAYTTPRYSWQLLLAMGALAVGMLRSREEFTQLSAM
jgi:hypothetical protein